jgi:peptide deformylase
MAIHEIIEVPDPRLKTVSTDVTEFNDELKTLVEEMFETMYAANGIGLAAIQIGIPKRLLVIDLQPEDPNAEPDECCDDTGCDAQSRPLKKEPRVFVNPVIVNPDEQLATYQEGCLSVPDIYADVDRPATCTVQYQDVEGNAHEEQLEGLMATCIQHEMDHLEGILFIDHLSRLKKQMALKKLKKLRTAA